MARRTVEVFECDICGEEGDRYTIQYPDGYMALDRCVEHADVVLVLKEEPGQWTSATSKRSGFQITSLEEIEKLKNKK